MSGYYDIAKYVYWLQSFWFLVMGSYLLVPGKQRHCKVGQQRRVAQLLGVGFCASGIQILLSHDALSLWLHFAFNFTWFLAVGPMRLDQANKKEKLFAKVAAVSSVLLFIALVAGATQP